MEAGRRWGMEPSRGAAKAKLNGEKTSLRGVRSVPASYACLPRRRDRRSTTLVAAMCPQRREASIMHGASFMSRRDAKPATFANQMCDFLDDLALAYRRDRKSTRLNSSH